MMDPCENCGAFNWRIWRGRDGVEHQRCLDCGARYEIHTYKLDDPHFDEKIAKMLGAKP